MRRRAERSRLRCRTRFDVDGPVYGSDARPISAGRTSPFITASPSRRPPAPCDLAAVIGRRDLNRAAARAERLGLLRDDDLATLVALHRRRRGAPLLRAAILDGRGPTLTRSEAEARFLELVRRGGLPPPAANVVVEGYEVDFLWRAERLVVEVDGFGYHASRSRFEADRRRDSDLVAKGFRVVRVTWRQLTREPDATLARVAAALAVTRVRPETGPG